MAGAQTSKPKPSREEYLNKPEIKNLLERNTELKAFLEKHPEIDLGREAYDWWLSNVKEPDYTYDYEFKPFPEMVLIQQYRCRSPPDILPEEQDKRLFVVALLNDEEIEKRFQHNAVGPDDGSGYKDPEGYLMEAGK